MHSVVTKFINRFSSLVFSFLLTSSFLFGVNSSLTYGIEDKEEAFLVRRIAEFWKDQDYKIVKAQIADFLEKYPKSKINDHLRGILGDLYLQEKAYEDAISVYDEIFTADVFEKTAINRLQCYYELNQFDEMLGVGTQFLETESNELALRSDELYFLMGEAYFRKGMSLSDQELKTKFLSKALPFYEKVLNSSFNDPAMFALAEIYKFHKDQQRASAFFMELSQRHPQQREDLMFHAALAQSEFDRSLAIETFSKIIDKDGVKAKDASLNRLILYFQEDRFRDVIDAYTTLIPMISLDKQTTLNYILGRSYFAIEEYENASECFEKYIAFTKEPSHELRNTLLMQLNCAQHLKNQEKYKEAVAHLFEFFPTDSEIDHAAFMHAMMLKESNDYKKAEEQLEYVFTNFPDFDDRESLLLEYGFIAHANNNWLKSYEVLNIFLKDFSNSQNASIAWKYLLSNALNLLKEIESGHETSYSKMDFHNDLTAILDQEGILNENEYKECLFLHGKIAFELEDYNSSLSALKGYIEKYPEDMSIGEAHLIIALSHHKLGKNSELFCLHAKTALEKNPQLENKASIHLELYNTYLTLIEDAEHKMILSEETENLDPVYSQAAEHLYQAMKLQDLPIKLDNQLWLANFYHDKIIEYPKVYQTDGKLPSPENNIFYTRSENLFANILVAKDSSKLISIGENNTFLEWETLKLAKFFGREKKYEQKIQLLTDLIEQQNKKSSCKWKMQEEALADLAKTYELSGEIENAYETFKFIGDHFQKEPSFISEYAKLHTLRLQFEMLNTIEKKEENADVLIILNDMKEFQIRKAADSEPLHLEAALEYAWIRAQIIDEDDQANRYLFFLNRIIEDFDNLEDPLVATYHEELSSQGEKSNIFREYMSFLDLEIARCKIQIPDKENNMSERTNIEQKLTTHYKNFLNNSSSFYLIRRAEKSLEALNRSKIS